MVRGWFWAEVRSCSSATLTEENSLHFAGQQVNGQDVVIHPYVDGDALVLVYENKELFTMAGINVARVALVNIPLFQSTGSIGDLFLWKAIALGVVLFIAMKKLKWHPAIFIAASAVIGILLKF